MNQLFIRADATAEMGTGHMMRCIALAQAWKKRGGSVTFLSYCKSHQIMQRIDSEGFNLHPIEKQWPHPQDLEQTLKILQSSTAVSSPRDGADWLVIDGYHFTHDYQRSIRKQGFKLLVIDDYNHLDQYNADLLLNQNIGANRYNYCCSNDTHLIWGTDYVMLRNEFLKKQRADKKTPSKARSILISLGGADFDNFTLTMIQAIQQISDPDIAVKIAIGPANPHLKTLTHAVQQHYCKIELIQNPDMQNLMAWADMAISAGGSTCWELCFMGVPFLTISLAENQNTIVSELSTREAAIDLGKKESLTTDSIAQAIMALSHDPDKRNRMVKSGKALIDGKGTRRIIRHMLAGKITVRPVKNSDANLLWQWANDAEVRSSSFHSDPIPWGTHLQWLEEKLNNNKSWIFIAENQSEIPVGQIRFDLNNSTAEISYSLAKEFRGLGLGKTLLSAGLKTMQNCIDMPVTIQGRIKQGNITSRTSFEKCGFTLLETTREKPFPTHSVYQKLLHPKS